jgi:hypothetical protein
MSRLGVDEERIAAIAVINLFSAESLEGSGR